ncbi:nucleotidyltransferase family protein [Candidatus Bathyarchaeota archaeon]|nr:nucleotidyltransferase family protein [Candidatus Bathyarchaeota archaeon]
MPSNSPKNLSKEIQLAAKYAYPFEKIEFDIKDFANIKQDKLLNILSQNGVLLTFQKNLSTQYSENRSIRQIVVLIDQIIFKRRHLIADFNQELLDHTDLFNKCFRRYSIPKFSFFYREQGDIDVLVPEEDFKLTLNFLETEGYTKVVEECCKATMAKWEGKRIITIDVYSILAWQPFYLELISTEEVLSNSVRISLDDQISVPVPNGEYCILVLAVHTLFGGRKVALSDIFQLIGITRSFPEINWHKITSIADDGGWSQDLLFLFLTVNQYSKTFYGKKVITSDVIDLILDKISILQKPVRYLSPKVNFREIPYQDSRLQTILSSFRVALKKYGALGLQRLFETYFATRPRGQGFIESESLRIPWFYEKIVKCQSPHATSCPSEDL